MKPFCEDIGQPLDLVERAWIRKPATLILYPLVLFLSVIAAIAETAVEVTVKWFSECWNNKI